MKESKIYNAKLEFLKTYLKNKKELEDEEVDNVWELLSEFYEELPARAKMSKDRKMHFSLITEQIQRAFEHIINKIANCPFVAIEIKGQEQQMKFEERVDRGFNALCCSSGYVAGGQAKIEQGIDEIKQRLPKV